MRAQIIGNGTLTARIPGPFAALIRRLQLRDADETALRLLRDEEWRQLLTAMDRARLTLPFAQLMHSGLPNWVQERIESNLADTARHSERVRAAYREAAAKFDANGVEYLVLKGFTQAPDFVPKPELRRQSDIDFYVPREHIPAALLCLQRIGYASFEGKDDFRFADHVPTLVRFGTWKWRGNIYDPDVPPAIEVHFCFWNESVSLIAIREFEDFWKRRRVRTLGDLSFPALHRVDHLCYFAMHILRDIFRAESSVNHVRELGTFLDRHSNDDMFWKEWTAMHSPRLRNMQAIAFSLAVAWFSCNVSDAVKAEIESLPPRARAWIRTCGSTPLETLFRRTRDGRLLQFLLAETPDARIKILWSALAPGRMSGPVKASVGTHPSIRTKPRLISRYLANPGYLFNRAWVNGIAVLRFIAHAFQVAHSEQGAT